MLSISSHTHLLDHDFDIFPSENTILHLVSDFPWTSVSIFATTASNSFSDIKSIDLLIRVFASCNLQFESDSFRATGVLLQYIKMLQRRLGVICQSPELLGISQ